MSSRVKQANFRLPLEYMAMIDDFADRDNLTKAAVITRALDCMKASYDSGHGGMPITSAGDNSAEIKELKQKLAQAQNKISQLEAKAHSNTSSDGNSQNKQAEVERLQAVVSSQETTIAEKSQKLIEKEKELAEKNDQLVQSQADNAAKETLLSEKEARIAALENRVALGVHGYGSTSESAMNALAIDADNMSGVQAEQALQLFNMLSGVMGAFRQQVEDARMLGVQEGRKAVNAEFRDIIGRARNDGYREAMTYLDDRVETARDQGAKEERARIANMRFLERRRYLKIHLI